MKISQLEYFLSVAKNLSFTKASIECHVVQSAISQQIHGLEEELGYYLFERDTRNVTLTRAGEQYYHDVANILKNLHEANERSAAIALGFTGSLSIGVFGATQSADLSPLIKFKSENPSINIVFQRADAALQYDQLKSGKFDIMFTASSNIARYQDVAFQDSKKDKLCLLVHKDHPLSVKKDVTLEEAAGYTNIFTEYDPLVEREHTPYYLYYSQNIIPEKIMYAKDQELAWLMLLLNLGISIVPESVKSCMTLDLVSLDLIPESYYLPTGWAYMKDNTNPSLAYFVDYVS